MPVKQEPILFPTCLWCGKTKRNKGNDKKKKRKERADKRIENISKSCNRVTQSPIVPSIVCREAIPSYLIIKNVKKKNCPDKKQAKKKKRIEVEEAPGLSLFPFFIFKKCIVRW